jgi:hypothetical protein
LGFSEVIITRIDLLFLYICILRVLEQLYNYAFITLSHTHTHTHTQCASTQTQKEKKTREEKEAVIKQAQIDYD